MLPDKFSPQHSFPSMDSKDIESYIKDADRSGGAEFVYLYNMKDKKWYYADTYKDSKLKKLF